MSDVSLSGLCLLKEKIGLKLGVGGFAVLKYYDSVPFCRWRRNFTVGSFRDDTQFNLAVQKLQVKIGVLLREMMFRSVQLFIIVPGSN